MTRCIGLSRLDETEPKDNGYRIPMCARPIQEQCPHDERERIGNAFGTSVPLNTTGPQTSVRLSFWASGLVQGNCVSQVRLRAYIHGWSNSVVESVEQHTTSRNHPLTPKTANVLEQNRVPLWHSQHERIRASHEPPIGSETAA